jgi:GTP pyrophosphokinase
MSSIAFIQTKGQGRLGRTLARITRTLPRPASGSIRESLGDWFFVITYPITAHKLRHALGRRRDELHKLNGMVAWLERRLAGAGIEAEVTGRLKRPSSIHRKMRRRGITLGAIHDLRGIRVIVEDEATCYQALAFVHRWCEAIPGQFDDYIAFPKRNGYRSLHTVVRARGGRLFELQIRTRAMHRVAERGSAAHRRYKGGAERGSAARPAPLSDPFTTPVAAPVRVTVTDRDYPPTPPGRRGGA